MNCDLRTAAPLHKAAPRLVEPTRRKRPGAGFQRRMKLFLASLISQSSTFENMRGRAIFYGGQHQKIVSAIRLVYEAARYRRPMSTEVLMGTSSALKRAPICEFSGWPPLCIRRPLGW